ncbi:MAG: N4-gp56 family major capsid protein, partial [Oscillospiraceae bacterium]
RDVIVPTVDKYRLAKLVANAPNVKEETLTAETAYAAFLEGSMILFDAHIPPEGRVAFVSPAYYKAIKMDKNFAQAGDKAYDVAVNGVVGMVDKTSIICVPTDYLPTGVNFIITHPTAMTSPIKISDYKRHENPQGINGWLVEGRIYYDAFVLNKKKSAIYVSKKAAIK